MARLQPNPVLDKALDCAFEIAEKNKSGKAKLLTLEGQGCEVSGQYGGFGFNIELDEDAEVHFFNLNTDSYGKEKKGGPIRDRRYYIITFGQGGSLSVDGREQTVRVGFRPSTLRRS